MQNKTCTILGGGTAGWLTALYIQLNWPDVSIQVIEDPNRPPIIAGESGGHALIRTCESLGIDTRAWAKAVGATPKLGGTFYGWNGKGSVFHHSLVTNYWSLWSQKFNSLEERYYYLRVLLAKNIPTCDMWVTGTLLKENKSPFDESLTSVIGASPMWHFDSRANADYLKQLGILRGITLVEGEYTHCTRNEQGNITSINLKDHRSISSDWFFDCSGFARLLLEKELKVEKIDYSQYFSASAVVAWWDKTDLVPSTIATAMDAGWSWKIGLRHRTGQGYLYDPNILSADQALAEARSKFGQHIEPAAKLRFTPEVLKESYRNNVIGIGLSTGFMEPLEANGTGAIVDSLNSLKTCWNPYELPDTLGAAEFNNRANATNIAIRDFLLLHYRGKGLDTAFWLDQRTNKSHIPDSLAEKLENWKTFYRTGKMNFRPYQSHYSVESWATVIQALELADYKTINIDPEIANYISNYFTNEKKLHIIAEQSAIGMEEWATKF